MNRDQFFGKKKQFLRNTLGARRNGPNDNPFGDAAGEHLGDHAQWARKQYEALEQRAERELKEFLRQPRS